MKIYTKNNKGFTMLFAVVISSLLLAVGMSIFNISIKELEISSTSRDSVVAMYAANTGFNCLFYNNSILNTPGNGEYDQLEIYKTTSVLDISYPLSFNCNDITRSLVGEVIADTNEPIDFTTLVDGGGDKYFYMTESTDLDEQKGGPCFTIGLKKWIDDTSGRENSVVKTSVQIRGYNVCDEEDSRRIERGLITTI